MAQKVYQKLRGDNYEAAETIYEKLKSVKFISEKKFQETWCESRGWNPKRQFLPQNFKTVKQFLLDHGLMTRHLINGLRVYAATQKCVRSKNFYNATKEIQMVKEENIQKAIAYVKVNNSKVPSVFEGEIVANILKLEGNHKNIFMNIYPSFVEVSSKVGLQYKVIGTVHQMFCDGMIKKI